LLVIPSLLVIPAQAGFSTAELVIQFFEAIAEELDDTRLLQRVLRADWRRSLRHPASAVQPALG